MGSNCCGKDNFDEYIRFFDAVVSAAYVPDPNDNPELHKLVTTYQVQSHSKSCRKYKNTDCRYNSECYFTNRTIVAVPLSKDLSEDQKNEIMQQRDNFLCHHHKHLFVYLLYIM